MCIRDSRPTHPKLLDYLAVEFMESGWSMKHIHRLIVHSSTYRQSSKSRDDLKDIDPNNLLLARGPRFRLDAEQIRDNALQISGLLQHKIGGPPVYPPQPNGLWRCLLYTSDAADEEDSVDLGGRRIIWNQKPCLLYTSPSPRDRG